MGGLLRMAVRAGIAKKVWAEARKPENQAKARELFAKLTDKGGTSAADTTGRRTGRTRRT